MNNAKVALIYGGLGQNGYLLSQFLIKKNYKIFYNLYIYLFDIIFIINLEFSSVVPLDKPVIFFNSLSSNKHD